MTYQIIIPTLIAFVITAVLTPIFIPVLRKLKVGNTEREELESHQKKAGTPTMGGIVILIAVLVASLFFVRDYPRILPILLVTIGFGIIGFLDDFLKVVLHRTRHKSDGLLAWQKMLCQLVVTALFCIYLIRSGTGLEMLIPFSGGRYLSIGWVAIPIFFLGVIGTVNGVNFTDGLDGLASGITIVVAGFFTVAAVGGAWGIEPITCAVIGALLGFLLYNCNPARVFMGDTGSLALGGFVAAAAYMMRMPIFILIVGLIYWIEIVSVIIQVLYFRVTGGKRFFKMAPIHHHFELSGWSETRVVTVFIIATVVLCLIGFIALWVY